MTHTTVIDSDEASYMAPEGFYLATLHTHAKGPNKKKEIKLRLRFELEVPKCSGVRFMAGRSFNPNLSEGSDLHWFLKVWLGEEKLNQFLESGADFDKLIGERGIAEILHVYEKQPKPFVNLESMRPVGFVQDHKHPAITTTTAVGYESPLVLLGFAYLQPALPELLVKMHSRSKPVASAPN